MSIIKLLQIRNKKWNETKKVDFFCSHRITNQETKFPIVIGAFRFIIILYHQIYSIQHMFVCNCWCCVCCVYYLKSLWKCNWEMETIWKIGNLNEMLNKKSTIANSGKQECVVSLAVVVGRCSKEISWFKWKNKGSNRVWFLLFRFLKIYRLFVCFYFLSVNNPQFRLNRFILLFFSLYSSLQSFLS